MWVTASADMCSDYACRHTTSLTEPCSHCWLNIHWTKMFAKWSPFWSGFNVLPKGYTMQEYGWDRPLQETVYCFTPGDVWALGLWSESESDSELGSSNFMRRFKARLARSARWCFARHKCCNLRRSLGESKSESVATPEPSTEWDLQSELWDAGWGAGSISLIKKWEINL